MKRTILITGANGFLGEYYVDYLIKKKHRIIAVDKHFFNLTKYKSEKNFYKFNCNISTENSLKKLVLEIKRNKLKVDAIINNAAIDAIPKKNKKSFLFDQKTWINEVNTSLYASTYLSLYFGQSMPKDLGRIINIGSDLSVIAPNQEIYKSYSGYIKPASYSVIKHGMLGLTKYLASLFAKKGVSVNMLSPGPILNKQDRKLLFELKKIIPRHRLANKKDLLPTLDYLLDKNNSYLTGQNIVVDGGRTII